MSERPEPEAGGARIAFYVGRPFHAAILEPVYELLRSEFPCLLTADRDAVVSFSPRVVLMADAYFRLFREALPQTVFVWQRHGFSSKNYLAQCVRGCDFACLTSEWTITELRAHGTLPHLGFWATGFVPMDSVLQGQAALPEHIRRRLGPGPTLLYAPTYEPALSAAPMLRDGWISHVRSLVPTLNVIIKPHPSVPETNPAWMTMWQRMAAQENAVLAEALDNIYTYFPAADLLLTDASSVMFYFLAMDRPIVLVSNPGRFGNPHFDPDGPEWAWRDMGAVVDTPEQVPGAVRNALVHPGEHAAQRARYRERVFGGLADGRAAERIANNVRALLRPSDADRPWVDLAWHSVAAMGSLRRRIAGLETELHMTVDRRTRRTVRLVLQRLRLSRRS